MVKTKWKTWLPIILVVALAAGGYYFYKTYWQLPNLPIDYGFQPIGNETSSQPTGSPTAVSGDVDGIVTAMVAEVNAEQVDGAADAGESALVNSVNQQMSDLNQSYDENQF